LSGGRPAAGRCPVVAPLPPPPNIRQQPVNNPAGARRCQGRTNRTGPQHDRPLATWATIGGNRSELDFVH